MVEGFTSHTSVSEDPEKTKDTLQGLRSLCERIFGVRGPTLRGGPGRCRDTSRGTRDGVWKKGWWSPQGSFLVVGPSGSRRPRTLLGCPRVERGVRGKVLRPSYLDWCRIEN